MEDIPIKFCPYCGAGAGDITELEKDLTKCRKCHRLFGTFGLSNIEKEIGE